MTDDDELMREIRAQFERAKEAAPKPIDALALATHLGARFEHCSVEEIRQKIVDHWQAHGLPYTG